MLNHLKNNTNSTYTENGALAFKTTKSPLLDFFAMGGASRERSYLDKVKMFTRAFGEDSLLAMKALFYFRDVREGQGEREIFRNIIRYMATHHTDDLRKNLHLISFYGRWDDLYELFGTVLEKEAANLMLQQFQLDLQTEYPSLLGKWLKSENASSRKTKRLAEKTRILFGLTQRQYQKRLSLLRKRINIVERLMSENRWGEIDYAKIPSQAGLRYRKAFFRNDEERYAAFLESLHRGEVQVNAGAVFPYEIVSRIGYTPNEEDAILNGLWDNLPDYFDGKKENAIAVVDVSGSMSGLPMDVAMSLGTYIAERNWGPYHNHFITFSSRPDLVELQGSTLCEKIRNLRRADWEMNTDLRLVFELLLNTAVEHNLPAEDMIQKLYIISDMEFDAADSSNKTTLYRKMKTKFEEQGYTLPTVVFWNVNSRNDQFPITVDDHGTVVVSGCSPSILKNLLQKEDFNPYNLMLDVLNQERYKPITV